jgi:hypothetical protein
MCQSLLDMERRRSCQPADLSRRSMDLECMASRSRRETLVVGEARSAETCVATLVEILVTQDMLRTTTKRRGTTLVRPPPLPPFKLGTPSQIQQAFQGSHT